MIGSNTGQEGHKTYTKHGTFKRQELYIEVKASGAQYARDNQNQIKPAHRPICYQRSLQGCRQQGGQWFPASPF